MRRLLEILAFSLLVGLLLNGCAVNNQKFFSKIESTTDLSYGYTAENPVTIKNAGLYNSIGSSYYYLSHLRSGSGNKLKLVERFSVGNPNYKEPAIALHDLYTGRPTSYGTGPLLDLYILSPENESDTIVIYINPYLKGIVKIPSGLTFEKE